MTTLPLRMHAVHTRMRFVVAPTRACTGRKLTFQRRLVTLWAWLMRFPDCGFLPQISHCWAITASDPFPPEVKYLFYRIWREATIRSIRSVDAQFDFSPFLRRRHPERPRFHQRAEGSQVARRPLAGDPFAMRLRAGSSLRLKNGCTQDDAAFKVTLIFKLTTTH